MIKNLKNYSELEWGVMPYPKIPKGKTVIPFGSWGYSITKNSKFINWIQGLRFEK